MKNKKAAGNVDWTISIGIFLIFLLTILVFIKPVYKPSYELQELGKIIKEPFLEKNSRTVYRTLVNSCYSSGESCDYIQANINNIGSDIYVTKQDLLTQAEIYQKQSNSVRFQHISSAPKYFVYHNLEAGEGENSKGGVGSRACSCNPIIGEATEYSGLKGTSIHSFDTPENFPDNKEFNIKIRNVNTGEILDNMGDEPPEDIEVSVYEFIYPVLNFQKTPDYIEKENVLVSFQIW